jgi:hypothetical protein
MLQKFLLKSCNIFEKVATFFKMLDNIFLHFLGFFQHFWEMLQYF